MRKDVAIYNCPGFQAGVLVGGMFWALAKRKILLVAKAESLELLQPPAKAEGN